MRFVGYVKSGGRDPQDRMMGVVMGDMVAPLATIDAFYEDLPIWKQQASALKKGEIPLANLPLAPPVPRDAKIVCAAINYVKHGAEAKLPTPTFPNLFARWASELVVDGAHIPVPAAEPQGLDWEVAAAAIVGTTAVDADEKAAAASIFGYTVANDVSGRAAQLRSATLSTGQWALGKNVDKSCPISSFIVTADTISTANLKSSRPSWMGRGHEIRHHGRDGVQHSGTHRLRVTPRHAAAGRRDPDGDPGWRRDWP